MLNKMEIGKKGEDIAAQFLMDNGFAILEKNYRCGRAGEMDIIARKGDLIIFVEVKSRSNERYGGALYSIGRRKINSLKMIARQYIARHGFPVHSIFRFDLIAVENENILWTRDIIRR